MRRHQQPFATMTATQDGITLRSSYDAALVVGLKSIVPSDARRFDGESKAWTIAPQYAEQIADLCERTIGIRPKVPVFIVANSETVIHLIDLRYLGTAKDKGGNEPIAFGWCDDGWNAIFPLSVLKRWFADDSPTAPGMAATLYAVLGAKRDVTTDELKTAYRRAVRTWHPDICKEPEAAEQFLRIKNAWDILGDTTKRAKYNAGLILEASIRNGTLPRRNDDNYWRPPLRCGYLLVEGMASVGRLNVSKILKWEDITRTDGAVLVTSWPQDAKTFEERWSIL